MSDAAALRESPAQEMLPPYHGEPITPWRMELTQLRRKAAQLILEHADPEEAFRVVCDAAHDLRADVKHALQKKHGRTFDRLIDGTFQKIEVREDGSLRDRMLAAIREMPGMSLREISERIHGRRQATVNQTIRAHCDALIGKRLIRGNFDSVPYRYYPVDDAADQK